MSTPPDLVLTDVSMPVVTGVELAERLRHRYTSIAILLIGGFIADGDLVDRLSRIGVPILRKPFTPDDLVRAVGDRLSPALDSRTG